VNCHQVWSGPWIRSESPPGDQLKEWTALPSNSWRGKPRSLTIHSPAGEHSALPHAQPGEGRLEAGLVVVDMGAMQGGYASDMTRMLHVGQPAAKTRRMYRAVLEAQLGQEERVQVTEITLMLPQRLFRERDTLSPDRGQVERLAVLADCTGFEGGAMLAHQTPTSTLSPTSN